MYILHIVPDWNFIHCHEFMSDSVDNAKSPRKFQWNENDTAYCKDPSMEWDLFHSVCLEIHWWSPISDHDILHSFIWREMFRTDAHPGPVSHQSICHGHKSMEHIQKAAALS